jgi:hypothetical protein
MLYQPRIFTRPSIPPIVCCNCGSEFQHERRCIYEARKAGWLVCSTRVEVKQINGTRREEFIGECPSCQRGVVE